MIGDNLVIEEHHRKAAGQIFDQLRRKVESASKYVITIGGESGSGKTEIAFCLKELFEQAGISPVLTFQQDDYFFLPPLSNARKRREDINCVGTGEVDLDLLNLHIQKFKNGEIAIKKPLINYKEDRILEERVACVKARLLILEGTYTTVLSRVDTKVFIDRSYLETRSARLKRAREEQDNHLEEVLRIEHDIISEQKKMADLILDENYQIILD